MSDIKAPKGRAALDMTGTFVRTPTTRAKRSVLGRILIENTGLKLLSLFFALVLWFFVNAEDRVELSFEAPVRTIGLDEGLVLISTIPPGITVQLEGPRSRLGRLNPSDLVVNLDLSAFTGPGVANLPILPRNVERPQALEVVRVSPSELPIKVDRKVERSVIVTPRFVGTPPIQVEVASVEVTPSTVSVQGPEVWMEDLKEVETDPIDLAGHSGDFTVKIPVHTGNVDLKPLSGEDVAVKVQMRPHLEMQRVEGIGVVVPGAFAGSRIEPKQVSVEVRVVGGHPPISPEDIRVVWSPIEQHPGALEVVLPEGVQLVRTIPEEIAVLSIPEEPLNSESKP
ncbi:MAG: hypothetical protein COX57_00810 [Alphaproteobacteria bacterium CG_4_10_14_0_2_um_filter_63_37]|nr:MAG: hypothetical protein COX57_00810 [Alphaproteobacteria bacterium CG_4_10_14_0_2_um_filter_63_37]